MEDVYDIAYLQDEGALIEYLDLKERVSSGMSVLHVPRLSESVIGTSVLCGEATVRLPFHL